MYAELIQRTDLEVYKTDSLKKMVRHINKLEQYSNDFIGSVGCACLFGLGLVIGILMVIYLKGDLYQFIASILFLPGGFIFLASFCSSFSLFFKRRSLRKYLERYKLNPVFGLTAKLDEIIDKHNRAVAVVAQTIKAQKAIDPEEMNANFGALAGETLGKLRMSYETIKSNLSRYDDLIGMPEDIFLQFSKVVTQDLAMPSEIDGVLQTDLSSISEKMEFELSVPYLNEVLECKDFLEARGNPREKLRLVA